jgi:hypothetical protein
MPKLFATTAHHTTDENTAREVVAYMLNGNQAVTREITPSIVLAEIDVNGSTVYHVIRLNTNGYGPDVDVDFEGGEALAEWKTRELANFADNAEVVDIECFTVETKYVQPVFNPNRTAYNPTSFAYGIR